MQLPLSVSPWAQPGRIIQINDANGWAVAQTWDHPDSVENAHRLVNAINLVEGKRHVIVELFAVDGVVTLRVRLPRKEGEPADSADNRVWAARMPLGESVAFDYHPNQALPGL